MNALIYHVAGGTAFFIGVSLMLVAAVLTIVEQRRLRSVASLTGILGLISVVISATPLPWWFCVVAGGISLVWLIAVNLKNLSSNKRRPLAVSLAITCLTSFGMELPYHFMPAVAPTRSRTITLFADSVSAGLSDNEKNTWPKILEKTRPVQIVDYSQMGATVPSALKKASNVEVADGIVLLEIGGNDLLGSTTVSAFERDLDALLARVSGPRRQVIMFELPLPPFSNAFGHAQRGVAARHGVALIPRRVFLDVLTADDATLDSIHLSKHGHERMAASVCRIIGSAFVDPDD